MSAPALEICEVGPRDGLQIEPRVLAPSVRGELVRRLAGTGVAMVEAGSVVREQLVPSMAGAEEVIASAELDGPCACPLALLVLNRRGLERALTTSVSEIHTVVPVTDSFGRKNQGVDADGAAAIACELHERAHADGRRATITLSVAFGCPFEGEVDPGRVAQLAADAAPSSELIVLADTIGAATPSGVRRVLEAVRAATDARLGLHLHNTRNAGYANALAGLEAGIDWFDASVGGFGGCPFAPLASGNIATEDLGWILEREGVEHGLDLDALARIAEEFGELLDRPVPGQFQRAGRPPVPARA